MAGRYVAALGRILRVRSGAESLVREPLQWAVQAGRTELAAGILRGRLERRESLRDRRRLRALRTADTSS